MIIGVSDQMLKEWKGEHNFFLRIKIKALQLVSSKYEDQHILYLDADTFLFGSLEHIRVLLNEGENLMHKNEGELSQLSSKTENLMWRQVKNKRYGGVTINSDVCMWNVGVVAISQKHTHNLIWH